VVDGPLTPCQYARERHRSIAKWRDLWTILLFIFGSAVVLFLTTTILLYIRESWLPAAISTLGTVVNGMAIKWVLDRRGEAVREEEEAYREVVSICQDVREANALRARVKLFGTIR